MMEFVNVQGARVPSLGLGTWEMTGGECMKAVKTALDLGYRHIDTAQIYWNEEEVGKALAESGVDRSEVFLTTKVWTSNLEYDGVLKSFNESLGKLRTEYVDLLLIHWPREDIPLSETLGAMKHLQDEGKARHMGVSNFTFKQLDRARKITGIFCNQVEYHPLLSQHKLLDYCQRNDIMLTAYSPLARGKILEEKTIREIGESYGKTPAQVTLRWLTQQKNVSAIPKSKTIKHQQDNLSIFDFKLTEKEMQDITKIARNERIVNPPFSPEWD